MTGDLIRHARIGQQRSLSEVAAKVKISTATLSRIETSKQGLDLEIFLRIARVLNVPAQRLLGVEDQDEMGTSILARQIAAMGPRDRAQFWRDLAITRRTQRSSRSADVRNTPLHVEELLAQVDFLKQEIESIATRMRRR